MDRLGACLVVHFAGDHPVPCPGEACRTAGQHPPGNGRGPLVLLVPPRRTQNFQVTISFSFKRNGEVLGKPRITYSTFNGDVQEQKRIMGLILTSLEALHPGRRHAANWAEPSPDRPFTMTFIALDQELGDLRLSERPQPKSPVWAPAGPADFTPSEIG